MFINYIRIAYRNLVKNKSYAVINIAGLAISMAACLMIGLFVQQEKSFDNIQGKENIYRLNEYVHYDGAAPQLSAAIGPPIAPFLKNNNPSIKNFARALPAIPDIYPTVQLAYRDKKLGIKNMLCVDSSFATMFGLKVLKGDKSQFLHERNSIVLTEKLATTIFGKEEALHQPLAMHTGDSVLYLTVSHIIANFPENAHLQADALVAIPGALRNGYETNYGVMLGPAYLQLQPGANMAQTEALLTSAIHEKNKFIDMRLQPLTRVHASSMNINYDYLNYNRIDGSYIKIFILIAIAIFTIACINFINLTVAISGYRGKEIAMKKILGARRFQLVLQVITEISLPVLAALLLAILLSSICIPLLNNIIDRNMQADILFSAPLLGVYGLILLFTTFIAGCYPAWLISSATISNVLKTKLLLGQSRTSLRNILVTGQFIIAIVFIISPVIFLKQLRYMRNKDLGYSYSQVIKLPINTALAGKLSVANTALQKIKGVEAVTNGFIDLGTNDGSLFGIDYASPDGNGIKQASVNFENAGAGFVHFFGMKIVSGKDLAKNSGASEYLVNETLARQLGYRHPVGMQLNLSGGWPAGVIVGVVKDFNYSSLHSKIEPLVINSVDFVNAWKKQLYVKISTAETARTLHAVEAVIKSLSADPTLSSTFMDEHFKKVYKSDQQAGVLVSIIGGLSIVLAAVGLLSLSAFIISKRTREIGIRKVMGASVKNILFMLSAEFLRLSIIAILVAFPLSWWALNKWLQGFAYRVSMGPEAFIVGGGAIFMLTIVIVSFQATRAALANPVKNLRTE